MLYESAVNYIYDIVDRQRSLCDVGCEYHFPSSLGSGLENFSLHVRRQSRINGQHNQLLDFAPETFHSVVYALHSLLNFVLASQKAQNISMFLSEMDLQDSHDGSLDIIGLRIGSIINVDWKSTAWDFDYWSPIEVF